jgi:fructose-specific phosphotransferase system IIC component
MPPHLAAALVRSLSARPGFLAVLVTGFLVPPLAVLGFYLGAAVLVGVVAGRLTASLGRVLDRVAGLFDVFPDAADGVLAGGQAGDRQNGGEQPRRETLDHRHR